MDHGPETNTVRVWSLPAKPMNSSGGEELNSSWRTQCTAREKNTFILKPFYEKEKDGKNP